MGLYCPSGSELSYDGLCYPVCKEGYSGVGPVCYGNCPAGYPSQGALCGKPHEAYGRGTGFISKSRCEASNEHGAKENGCEEYAGLWYPKCDSGLRSFGCCICTP